MVLWIAEHQWTVIPDIFLFGSVFIGLYIIGPSQLCAYLKEHERFCSFFFYLCYSIGMLIEANIIGQTIDLFKPWGFSSVMACFFSACILILVRVSLMKKLINS
ncbi:hypothetical protein H709_00616 [Bartonella bacilliformis CUSCO5]|nr:hypothetical protein X470_00724 [Bartonella bacilliformis Peru-18]KEG17273.1 hypothetical protein H709_00616 [Bartonella bacilliformis CUSCO5]KEG22907.1 hypothetical protein H703_00756 [Bartonella bacilliformis Ver075]